MRDPKRIHPFIVELEALWLETPDLRFGQLVSNLYGNSELSQFYTEDTVIFERIRRRIDA